MNQTFAQITLAHTGFSARFLKTYTQVSLLSFCFRKKIRFPIVKETRN